MMPVEGKQIAKGKKVAALVPAVEKAGDIARGRSMQVFAVLGCAGNCCFPGVRRLSLKNVRGFPPGRELGEKLWNGPHLPLKKFA
jgi:hypothetical protein